MTQLGISGVQRFIDVTYNFLPRSCFVGDEWSGEELNWRSILQIQDGSFKCRAWMLLLLLREVDELPESLC